MAEDKSNEEEKFDFTAEGEGYISLAEARVLAVRTAVETPGDYGGESQGVAMVFEVVESGEDEDFYTVHLSFRPQGNFAGTPGQEQFVIGKDGTIAVRQILSAPVRKEGGFPILPVAIGVVVVGIIAAVGAILLISSSGGDSVPIAVAPPTETPAPTDTLAPTQPPAAPTETPVLPMPTPTTASNALSYYNKGNVNRDAENWDMAIGEYTKAIQVNPSYSSAYFFRGYSYGKLGQHQSAIEDYDEAIRFDPDYALAYEWRGASLYELGQYQRAIEAYDKAIELNPDYALALSWRGASFYRLGQYQRAIQDYDKAIELNPDDAFAFNARAISYYKLGQTTSADADITTACSLDSQYC